MCPACMASAALVISGVMTGGGLTALAAKLLPLKNSMERLSSQKPKGKEK